MFCHVINIFEVQLLLPLIIEKKKVKIKKNENLVKIDVKPMFQLYIDGMH